MRVSDYLYDKKGVILFFAVLMLFFTAVMYFDNTGSISDSNIAYVLFVSITLFIIYLLIDYFINKGYYSRLRQLQRASDREWVNNLPSPSNIEQKINNELLLKLYNESNTEINSFIQKGKEDLEFVTAWVHEIKTPIAVTRLLIENNINNPTEKTLLSIDEEIDRIDDFVQKSLYYSRVNDFSKDYIIDTITLDSIVKDSVKKHSKSFISKSIKISLESLDSEIPTDKKWLGFILDQIISNAVKYTEPNGTIKIYSETNSSETLLHIVDNGIGIKPEDISRVFDKSFTGSNGREMKTSTGIGLYLSQKLAKKLGHYITIESEYKKGATVTVHFPKWSDYYKVTKV